MKNNYYLPLLLTLSIISINAEQENSLSTSELLESTSPAYSLGKSVISPVHAFGKRAYAAGQDFYEKLRGYLQTDLNKAQSTSEHYPLHEAAKKGELEEINALIARGEDVNAQDKEGKTPLHYAIGKDKPILDALIAAGADLEIKDNTGKNPVDHAQTLAATSLLWNAIENKDAYSVRMYVEHGADVNARGGGDITPLHLAVFVGDEDIIKTLQDAGADTTLKDDSGITALQYKTLLDLAKKAKAQEQDQDEDKEL